MWVSADLGTGSLCPQKSTSRRGKCRVRQVRSAPLKCKRLREIKIEHILCVRYYTKYFMHILFNVYKETTSKALLSFPV